VAAQPSVRALGQAAPDLAVETATLPGLHRQMAREGVKQADVLVRGVADLPVEEASSDLTAPCLRADTLSGPDRYSALLRVSSLSGRPPARPDVSHARNGGCGGPALGTALRARQCVSSASHAGIRTGPSMLALLLAAIAVGLGNFGASISIGLSGTTRATRIRVGVVFGIFEAGMPLAGLLAGQGVARALGDVSGYVGGTLLIGIGAWQLVQAFRAASRGPAAAASLRRLLLTGLALSMDNLVVGFSLGVQHTSLIEAVAVFATVSVCLSLLGLEVGRRLGAVVEIGAEYLAGLILMAVGLIVAVG